MSLTGRFNKKKMIKNRKLPKICEDIPVTWLDKGWVDKFIEDWRTQNEGDVRRPSLMTEALPPDLYYRLATLWGMDPRKAPRATGNTCKIKDKEDEENKFLDEFIQGVEKELGIRSNVSEDLQVNAVSRATSQMSETKGISKHQRRDNPYLKFLKNTGGLPTERHKTNLEKKAGKITKLIIKKFLEWYQSLGGNDGETFIEESTLEELFQIGFDMQAAKAMTIRTQELPTVPECLALLRNEPQHSSTYCLRKILKDDIQMENIPPKMYAFGSMLPKERPSLRYKPPRNFVKETWMECSRVPSDLDTMKTIWVGLEKLRSTIAFANWLKNHPEITPPPYLKARKLLQINYEEWNQLYKGFEMDADHMPSVASELNVIQQKSSIQAPKMSATNAFKMESYDSIL